MKHIVAALLIAGVLVIGVPAFAHHSFAATYFEDKTVKIEGDLVQFLYRNPHSFVHVEVKEADGSVTRWAMSISSLGRSSRVALVYRRIVTSRRRKSRRT